MATTSRKMWNLSMFDHVKSIAEGQSFRQVAVKMFGMCFGRLSNGNAAWHFSFVECNRRHTVTLTTAPQDHDQVQFKFTHHTEI